MPWRMAVAAERKSILIVSSDFMGLQNNIQFHLTQMQNLIIVADRTLGYFVLGLWVGVAAVKLGKLSAE